MCVLYNHVQMRHRQASLTVCAPLQGSIRVVEGVPARLRIQVLPPDSLVCPSLG